MSDVLNINLFYSVINSGS